MRSNFVATVFSSARFVSILLAKGGIGRQVAQEQRRLQGIGIIASRRSEAYILDSRRNDTERSGRWREHRSAVA